MFTHAHTHIHEQMIQQKIQFFSQQTVNNFKTL